MTARAALYHRASSIDQDVTLARDELRSSAKARGLDVVMDVEESGSGANNDRPGLQRILDAARRRKIDAVVVWKLDRFARSALDLLTNVRTLTDAGVEFIATSQGIHIGRRGDAMSSLMLTVLAGVAEFERSLIIERTKLGLDKARRQGKRIGRPRAANAPTHDAVVALRANGLSWSQVAQQLGCTPSAAQRAMAR